MPKLLAAPIHIEFCRHIDFRLFEKIDGKRLILCCGIALVLIYQSLELGYMLVIDKG